MSTIIITLNEEKNIERSLKSVLDISDEVIVIDSFSTDRTSEICAKLEVKFIQNSFEDYSQQKNFGISKCKFDLVLSIDADEEISEELIESIKDIKNNKTKDAYSINRLTNYCGKWIRHCGWYPDKKIRLFDKNKFEWKGHLHEELVTKEDVTIGRIKNNILHYSYGSYEEHLSQMNTFSSKAALDSFQKGKRTNFIFHIIFYPFITFIKNYLFKLGFLDGKSGFIVCINSAYYRYLKYIKLYKLQSK